MTIGATISQGAFRISGRWLRQDGYVVTFEGGWNAYHQAVAGGFVPLRLRLGAGKGRRL
jgi:hypothetical protein